jgi:arginyl-tRNA synthetase
MLLDLQARLARSISETIRHRFDVEPPAVAFQYPPRAELGDLAITSPFDLAKTLRRKPREIASELVEPLQTLPGVRAVEVAGGGYVNLFLDRGAFALELQRHLTAPDAVSGRGRVIVEHTSINPNKAAHVGHLRNAILGDTFVRLLRFRGHEVGVQNYIDDTGV